MSKFMGRKGKEPKKPPKDPNAAPALPDRIPPKPQVGGKPPGGYSDQLPPLPAPLPPRSNDAYPGKWKPPAREAATLPPQPSDYNLPQSNSNNSFDDEYVAPGDLDNGTNDMFRGNQMTSHGYQPSTPPISDDEEYVAPDEVTRGHANGTAYPANYREYQQQNMAVEDTYAGADGSDGEDTYDVPDQALDAHHQYRVTTPPPPLEPEDNYDAPDDLNLSPPHFPPPEAFVEENYDVPDGLDFGGHAPSTPPLPDDTEDTYDCPDSEMFSPPSFKPPAVLPFKPQLSTPANLSNNTVEPIKPNTISELSKRFANKSIPDDLVSPYNTSTPSISPMKPSVHKQNAPTPVAKPSMGHIAPPLNRLQDQVWFKEGFNRKASENFLRSYCIDGGFVVRPSAQEPGDYSYSIYYQGEIRHLKLRKKMPNNKYSVGEEKDNELEFDSVMDCVTFHRSEPLILKAGGEVCLQILQ